MKQTRSLMGMHITVEVVGTDDATIFKKVFDYFDWVDQTFSTYKKTSQISKINEGILKVKDAESEVTEILHLAEKTKQETEGFFDIYHNGSLDPSGIVKGWAILEAAKLVKKDGYKNFYIDAGGDIQVSGTNSQGKKWRVGIKNPFNEQQIVKVLEVDDKGVATSGTYIRGQHVYNPFEPDKKIEEIVSLTVIGPDILKADRFATAAFAMGKAGIEFIEKRDGLEGYMIDKNGIATMTSGFKRYEVH